MQKAKMSKNQLESSVKQAHIAVMNKLKNHWKVKDMFGGSVDHKDAKR